MFTKICNLLYYTENIYFYHFLSSKYYCIFLMEREIITEVFNFECVKLFFFFSFLHPEKKAQVLQTRINIKANILHHATDLPSFLDVRNRLKIFLFQLLDQKESQKFCISNEMHEKNVQAVV